MWKPDYSGVVSDYRLMADGASGGLSWWLAGMILAGEITHCLLVMRCSVDVEKLQCKLIMKL